jgi:hypothetical protein
MTCLHVAKPRVARTDLAKPYARRIAGIVLGGSIFAGSALLSAGASRAAPAPDGIELQPHRIVYEVSLGPKSGNSSFSSARGLIALEFTGNACDGYATNFRQATVIGDADGGSRNLDFQINLWEEGSGKSFRFTVNNKVNGATTRNADGVARRVADGSISVTMTRPKGSKGDFDGAVSFPTAMMIDLIRVAQKGERRFDARVFDGSEGGEKIYDTIATIGPKMEGDRNARLEPAMRGDALDSVPRWPVSIAYYENVPGDRVPVYTLRSVTFANGIVSDLLFEFADFSLVARATRYEPLKTEACRK